MEDSTRVRAQKAWEYEACVILCDILCLVTGIAGRPTVDVSNYQMPFIAARCMRAGRRT
jgi:hypothetical protein